MNAKKKILIVFILFGIQPLYTKDSYSNYNELLIGISNTSAPWRMRNEEGYFDCPFAELMRVLCKKLSLKPKFVYGPVKRLINELKSGKIDLLSLLKTKEREVFTHYILEYKRKSNKAFFVRKGNKYLLNKYEDLYGKNIGTIRGKRYFKRFDNDKKIKKHVSNNYTLSFRALIHKRIDAVIATDSEGHYHLKKLNLQNKIENTQYKYDKINGVWLTLSKKSVHRDRLNLIQTAFKEMYESGQTDKIISSWFIRKGLAIPDYK